MTELVPYRADRINRDWVQLMAPAVELAQQVANTSFVPDGLRGNGPAIVAAILYGDEVGLGPMQALAKIAVINGRPTLSAEAQRALILAAGHELWVVESNNTRVTVAGRRHGSEQTSTVTWTLDDAKRANLAGKQNWRLYPRQMLLARATAELARLVFADVIGGLAATEEADGEDLNGSGPTGEVKTEGATTKRKRRNVSAAAATTVLPPEEPAPRERPALPGEEPQPEPLAEELGTGTPAPVPVPEEPAEAPPEVVGPPEGAPTEARPKRDPLDVLVGRLRRGKHITTEQLYAAVSRMRNNLDADIMTELVGGRDADGVLHWAPLRDSLSESERADLSGRLIRLDENVKAAAEAEA